MRRWTKLCLLPVPSGIGFYAYTNVGSLGRCRNWEKA
jgi:hypothetical protein